jgi:N6-L-threonylcarbamoyladenine synthase
MKILSIETSCDETAVAIIEADEKNPTGFKTLASVVSSQVELHAEWGGVVPNLAAREHLKNTIPVLDEALNDAKLTLKNIDLFVVTKGPGLIPALLLGVNTAKTLAYFHKKPLVGVHHVAGHILSAFSDDAFNFSVKKSDFPLLTLTVSGGHTQLIYTDQPFNYKIIGETQDDAAGEAFDKVAKILGLDYPGGPIISKLADEYVKKNNINLAELDAQPNDTSVKKFFPRPMINQPNFNFSFSGLKTAVLYYVQNINPLRKGGQNSRDENFGGFLNKHHVSYEFQEAVVDVLITKTIRALKKYPAKTITLAGGVAANTRLRSKLENSVKQEGLNFKMPPISLTGDNAVMIAAAGFYEYLHHKEQGALPELNNTWSGLDADANLKLQATKINL